MIRSCAPAPWSDEIAAPRIQEHYRIDEAGLVRVTITDLTDGYSRRYVLGQRTE